jgi:hypothetical protein
VIEVIPHGEGLRFDMPEIWWISASFWSPFGAPLAAAGLDAAAGRTIAAMTPPARTTLGDLQRSSPWVWLNLREVSALRAAGVRRAGDPVGRLQTERQAATVFLLWRGPAETYAYCTGLSAAVGYKS